MAWETDGNATEALFNEATACAMLCSRPRLPGAVDAIFETGQLLGADRAAGVKLTRGDSDFRTEAEFAAVGELGRRVMQHDRRIDLVEEFAGGVCIVRHDRIGVMRTVVVNMRDRVVDAVHHFGGDDRVLIFGIPVFVGGRLHPGIGALYGVVAADLATGVDQHLDQRLEAGRRALAIDQQGFGGAADAGTSHLGVQHDRLRHFEIGGMITSTPPFNPVSSRPTADRSRVGTSVIAASGRSASRNPCTRQSWIARQERKLYEPTRKTTALPDFRHTTPASAATLGRLSKMTATTPSGTRTRSMTMPFGRCQLSVTMPMGSAISRTVATPSAIASMRACVSVSRSMKAAVAPVARTSATSSALAARIADALARMARSIASSA